MKGRFQLTACFLAAVCLVGFSPLRMLGQDQPVLTLNEVKNRLKENKKYLDDARKHGKAGDAAGVETAVENYDRSMEGLNRALNSGRFEGDEGALEEAYERVEKATSKHGQVLADLLTKVPEQARPAIERAMVNSQKGRTTALANLERVRNARQERLAAEERQRMGRSGQAGRPGSLGRPEGLGGVPTGIGGARPVGGGRPGGVGGGRPPGGGRGPR